ncbi:hypothetical protein A2U01_0065773, partial [Trifolium medium]|nr:hypothetical protein [Trifolium medium]
ASCASMVGVSIILYEEYEEEEVLDL